MAISQMSERLLREHARRANQLFYGLEVLGSLFRDTDVNRLDQAYAELADAKLMESSGVEFSYFGARKTFFRITSAGLERAAQQPAA